jgi:hypothetical protein
MRAAHNRRGLWRLQFIGITANSIHRSQSRHPPPSPLRPFAGHAAEVEAQEQECQSDAGHRFFRSSSVLIAVTSCFNSSIDRFCAAKTIP